MKPTATPLSHTGRLCLMTGMVLAAHVHLGAHAAPPVVVLPSGPVTRTLVHPNVLLDLSVEYPTAGSAYRAKYMPTQEYVGHFESTRCYTYVGGNATYSGGKYDATKDINKYFVPAGQTTSDFKCNKQFSGNWMNWATSSAIDMLRLALTGGNRVIDEVGKTVLERAYLRDEMYNSDVLFSHREVGTASAGAGGVSPQDVTPFTNSAIYVVSCRNRVLFSTNEPAKAYDLGYTLCDKQDNSDKNLGEFVVRTQVCTESERVERAELCKPYPANSTVAGQLKPVGEIQTRADEFYFGAMGYLLKDGPEAYGGVLRAPLKHVGPYKYDDKLLRSNNKNTEWNKDTGIFTNVEGVVNYLNKFGSTGLYKRNDPVSELYYESLRYLRGLKPSPEATASMNPANAAWRYCAPEGGTCTLPSGTWEVRYGENNTYFTRSASSSIGCNNNVFGDPLRHTFKHCDIRQAQDVTEGFPVFSDWMSKETNDPIIASCQRNAIVLVADANTNYDFSIPGNKLTIYHSDDSSKVADYPKPGADGDNLVNPLNARDWTNKVGDYEVTNVRGTKLKSPLGDQKNGWRDEFHSDDTPKGSYYLSGLAYWANTSQMRKDKKNIHARTFVIDVDERGNGDINNRAREFFAPRDSQLYLAAKYGYFDPFTSDDPGHASPLSPYAPGPRIPGANTPCASYLWDLNGDCKPENYFLASEGTVLVEAIHNIMERISIPGESANLVSKSSSTVTPGQTEYVYQASGDPQGGWSGDVVRAEIKVNISGALEIGDFNPNMTASKSLGTWSARNILTMDVRNLAGPPRSTVTFQWTNLTLAQQALLNGKWKNGEKRLKFLRGSTADEVSETKPRGLFRRRPAPGGTPNVLGDIVNSSPVYVGAPRTDILDKNYAAWRKANAARKAAVYVGANDGMLHAFNKDLTEEYFAYIPNLIFDKLPLLTRKNYLHTPTVDGNIAVNEASTSAGAGGGWKTVLVGGLGAGAQGVYALDVTKPDQFSKTNGLLWEFGDMHDKDMGNVFSAPNIAKFVSKVVSGVPVYHYYAVVASGINHYAPDANTGNDKIGGALFLLSLQKSFEAPWVAHPGGTTATPNYHKIPVPLSDAGLQSGLSAPALVTGPDGAVRFAYAGDLQGNLWRFDFTKPLEGARPPPRIIFTAKTSANVRQPITVAPKVVFAEGGGFVVLFGTGKYLEDSDLTMLGQNSFYGIYDEPANPGYSVASRSSLQERTIQGTVNSKMLAVVGDSFIYYNLARSNPAAKKGWFVDFLQPEAPVGERSTTPAELNFGKVFFNTLLPPTDTCDPKIKGRAYTLHTLTGLTDGGSGNRTGQLTAVGALSSPIVFATNENAPVDADALGQTTVQQSFSVLTIGKDSLAKDLNEVQEVARVTKKTANFSKGRLGWREILNYKELRDER